jgi:hypothetical protein
VVAKLFGLADVGRLRSFLALSNLELYFVAFLQAFVSFRRNGAVVHKNIRAAIVASNKAISLSVVKPLYRTSQTFHLRPPGHVLLQLRGRAFLMGQLCFYSGWLSRDWINRKPLSARF